MSILKPMTCVAMWFCVLPTPSIVSADDWTEWRGEDRQAVWHEDGILDAFPDDGLKTAWRIPIGSGYSGPVVSHGRVVTMDYHPKPDTRTVEAIERIICVDEQSGELLWKDEWETHYRELMGSYRTGPRATPTVDGDRVYAVGAAGHIRCVSLEDGELIWSKDSREDFQTQLPIWGISTAPIVAGDLVIFATGGKNEQVRAFNKTTGEEVWKAVLSNTELGYSQFILIEHAGVQQLIYWDPTALHSLNPQTGEIYWSVPMSVGSNMTIATPVKSGSHLLVSSFYSGSMLVELDDERPDARKLWHIKGESERPNGTEGLHSVITTPLIEGDHIYGTCSYGELRGLELDSGERVWENKELTRQGRWGSAYFVKNGDRYFMVNDEGELLIVRFTPEGVEEIDRTLLIEPDTESGFGPRRFANSIVNWVHPAFANGHVIIRNDHEMVRVSLQK